MIEKYVHNQPKIVKKIKIELGDIGVFYNKVKKFVIIDKNIEIWEDKFQEIVDKEYLEGNTIDCIKSENGRYILYDLSYAWIDDESDNLDELFKKLNLIQK